MTYYRKRKSPYKFKTHLNPCGDTVVILTKDDQEIWLFNIGRDGILQFDILYDIKKLKKIGLKVNSDGMPEQVGYFDILEIKENFKRFEDYLDFIKARLS